MIFVKKQSHKAILILIATALIVAGVVYGTRDGLKTKAAIRVIGDEECQKETAVALQYLKESAPAYYTMSEKYIGIIECAEAGSGINVFERPPRFVAGRATREAGTEWYAGSIVHDACHISLFEEYKRTQPFSSPPPEIWSGETAEKKCIEIQTEALKEAGAPDWVFESLEHATRSRYWEHERWW